MELSLSCNFDYLVATIGNEGSDLEWFKALNHFCSVNAHAFTLPIEGKEEFLKLLQLKISEKCSQNVGSNLECRWQGQRITVCTS